MHFTANQKYTNLGLLFSDQNPFTFKLAVYQSNEKNNFEFIKKLNIVANYNFDNKEKGDYVL